MHQTSWKSILKKLETRVNILGSRNISLKGRTLTAGALLASKIWYTTYVFPLLMSQADDIQRILNKWSRKGGISLPSAKILQLPKPEGGWNLTNVKSALMARSAMITKKLLFSDQPWAKNKRSIIKKHQKNLTKIQKSYRKRDWPTEVRKLIKTWFMAEKPQGNQATTFSTIFFFKKNIYLKKKWPSESEAI